MSYMRTAIALAVLLLVPSFIYAQQGRGSDSIAPGGTTESKDAPVDTIRPGAKVFIEPMNGFENYLEAAIQKKQVPITVVTDREKADFILTGNNEHKGAGWAKMVFMGNIHSDEQASISVISVKSSAVLFSYAVDKKNTLHGQQTSAEACAKHLRQHIEGKKGS
jgi:hypothetical protein